MTTLRKCYTLTCTNQASSNSALCHDCCQPRCDQCGKVLTPEDGDNACNDCMYPEVLDDNWYPQNETSFRCPGCGYSIDPDQLNCPTCDRADEAANRYEQRLLQQEEQDYDE